MCIEGDDDVVELSLNAVPWLDYGATAGMLVG